MLQPLLRRTWSKKGCTPKLTAWDRHDRLTCIAALTLNPNSGSIGQYFQIQKHNATASDFLRFLVDLKKQIRRPMIVIWDRLSAHRSVAQLFREMGCQGIHFEFLAAYSPELNPVEHLWSTTKWGRLSNWAAPDIGQLEDRLQFELDQQATERSILRSHFEWAGLKTKTACLRSTQ